MKIKKNKIFSKAEYNPIKATLIVTLKNGKRYAFKGIDHIVFETLKKKKNPSKFLKKKIIGTYFAKKVN